MPRVTPSLVEEYRGEALDIKMVKAATEADDARMLPTAEKVINCHQLPHICAPEPSLERRDRRRRDIEAVLLESGEG